MSDMLAAVEDDEVQDEEEEALDVACRVASLPFVPSGR